MTLRTLNLPPLARDEARSVEEALISHFGPHNEPATAIGSIGQLDNRRHELAPAATVFNSGYDYCQRLRLGQRILILNHYSAYFTALYTRTRSCPAPTTLQAFAAHTRRSRGRHSSCYCA